MKKTISVLLALVLTVGLFSACSKDGKEETTTAAPAAYTLAYTYDSHYAQTDPSAVRAYEKIAKAIAEGGVAVRVNTDMMDDVNRLLYTGFPLMALVDTVSVNSDNSGVTIKYKNDGYASPAGGRLFPKGQYHSESLRQGHGEQSCVSPQCVPLCGNPHDL